MTGLEPLLVKVGSAVVKPAVAAFLADRKRREERALPLAELVNRRATDALSRRKINREIEALVDTVADHLAPLARQELADLPEHERTAALDAVRATFAAADLSDDAFFAADADPVTLAHAVRAALPDAADRVALSESARRFYDAVLGEVCVCFAQLVVHLPSFGPRATAELLSRLSGIAGQLAAVYARLPARTLDAPAGTDLDAEFRERYLRQISDGLDTVELFGVDVRNYRPRTTLSVAYISLAVRGESDGRRRSRRHGWEPGLLNAGGRHGLDRLIEETVVRVESALSASPRMLIRGEAGSGKSTLLRWLAITAARGHFTAELTDWNGLIPFLVKLRSHAGQRLPRPGQFLDGQAEPIAELMPDGWVHRVLASGRALLMVDGVDELPTAQRRATRDWLRDLLTTYPDIRVVVTSRPAAAAERWLSGEGFGAAMLERMGPDDVRSLIHHWHDAIRDAGDLPCDESELPGYESALLARLDSTGSLQALATNPLLCAMLCALNLDRNTQLPTDRMGVYAAAIGLLLERRDALRGIPGADVGLSIEDKLQLLQHLAWRLSINSRTELDRAGAAARIAEKINAMPRVDADPDAVLDHLLTRSGIIAEPVPDRVEFVHRTFQEYLTAREAAEQGDVGLLVDRAHLDTWHDTVLLAAGHANAPTRTELVTLLLDRADAASGASRRALRLVAASCLETIRSLNPPELLDRLHASLAGLIPPRRRSESRSLAGVGDPALRALPRDLAGLTESQAAACVRTAALVNGPAALKVLAGYASDPRHEVQRELADCWEFFDPAAYADSVLADAPLVDGLITVRRGTLLGVLDSIKNIRGIEVRLRNNDDARGVVRRSDVITFDWSGADPAAAGIAEALDHLLRQRSLERLWLTGGDGGASGLQMVRWHPGASLRALVIRGFRTDGIGFVRKYPDLFALDLELVPEGRDLRALAALPKLRHLWIDNAVIDVAVLRKPLAVLATLQLGDCTLTDDLRSLADAMPALRELNLVRCRSITDLGPLRALTSLTYLMLSSLPIQDLRPIEELPNLRSLTLWACEIDDLGPISRCRRLRRVDLRFAARELDLTPLAGSRMEIVLGKRQPVRGVDQLGSGVRLVHQ